MSLFYDLSPFHCWAIEYSSKKIPSRGVRWLPYRKAIVSLGILGYKVGQIYIHTFTGHFNRNTRTSAHSCNYSSSRKSCRYTSRASVNVIKHKNGGKCDLSDFDHGMIVGVKQAGLSTSETDEILLRFSCTTFNRLSTEWCEKEKETCSEW